MKTAAVLWTGGKDSAMALLEAKRLGYGVQCLATFAPPESEFLAHPLSFIKLQAQALDLPHYVLPIRAPFDRSYEAGLRSLQADLGIDCVVTGDIAESNGHPNWICERSRAVGIEACAPLWGRRRSELLQQLATHGFDAYISFVQTQKLDVRWVGRKLDSSAISELSAISAKNGLDPCGENGEYHTLVTGGPLFKSRIAIRSYSVTQARFAAYMELQHVEITKTTSPSNNSIQRTRYARR